MIVMSQNRSGYFTQQLEGFKAFIPKPLPPDPPIAMDSELISVLSEADRSLGRLDGITETLPNPDLFVAMYVKKEAVLSSQIEGTQASLIDVLEVEDEHEEKKEKNVAEVVNYVRALNFGLERLRELPLCLRLLNEIHNILMEGVRGSEKNPGEFRRSQNWLGPAGSTITTATFVPPPVHEMKAAMGDLEKFFHEIDELPPLIKIGLIHAQFETIHPYLDGNGRMGRLLITFWLCQQKILNRPLLYLSYYFKVNRSEYYDRLTNIRTKGDWEGWTKFFLKGIAQVSNESTKTAKDLIKMKDEHSQVISSGIRNPSNGLKVLESLFEHPIVTINKVAGILGVSYPTASSLVSELCDLKILRHDPTKHRNKKFYYGRYIDLLQAGTELLDN
jgi:Fic family protein